MVARTLPLGDENGRTFESSVCEKYRTVDMVKILKTVKKELKTEPMSELEVRHRV